MKTLKERFDQFEDEYIQFDRIQNPMHHRPDICAFLMLDKLVPATGDIVTSAEHDEIYLDVDCDKLNEVATDGDICNLHRCGVRFDESCDSLAMFV